MMEFYKTVQRADEEGKPSFRNPATMNPRTWTKDLTWYFMFLLFSSTFGPLLFGFHLVSFVIPVVLSLLS